MLHLAINRGLGALLWAAGLAAIFWSPPVVRFGLGFAMAFLVASVLVRARLLTRCICLVLGGAAGAAAWFGNDLWALVAGLGDSVVFIAFLGTGQLMHSVAEGDRRARKYAARYAQAPIGERAVWLQTGAHILGSVLNLGAVAALSTAIPDDAPEEDRQIAARACLRGVAGSVIWSPFYLAMGIVILYLPDVEPVYLLPGGLALALLQTGFGLAWSGGASVSTVRRSLKALLLLLIPVGTVTAVILAVTFLTDFGTIEAIILAIPLLAALALLRQASGRFRWALGNAVAKLGQLGDEVAIIAIAMALGAVVRETGIAAEALTPLVALNFPPGGVIMGSLALLIGGAIIGIHPMITATLILTAQAEGNTGVDDRIMALTILVGWGHGSMISFSGIVALFGAALFKIRLERLIYGANLYFSLLFTLVAGTILALVNSFL